MSILYSGSGPGGAIQDGVDQWTPAKAELVRQDLFNLDARVTDLEDATVENGALLRAEVAVSASELLALRATPKTLVAAPGAGMLLEFVSSVIILDAGTAYVETADNVAIRYANTTGDIVSETLETTGFLDTATDAVATLRAKEGLVATKTASENKSLVLHNTGDGEFTTGTGTLRVKVLYRVWTTGW
jgi:hypothetical protein